MSNEQSELLQMAVEKKRAGELEESLQCYLDAINLDLTNSEIYMGLGKTTYLLGNDFFTINAYLSRLHLLMHDMEKQMENDVLPEPYEDFYEGLSDEVKATLPRKSAVVAYMDYNLAKHLGHVLLDFDPSRPEETDGLVEIYRAQIAGESDYSALYDKHGFTPDDVRKIEEDIYIPSGRKFLLDFVEWEEIADPNVIDIYFDEDRAKKRFAAE